MQTYKFYLPTGERLAIFYENRTITVIPCSKNDQFSKKIAKNIFNEIGINRIITDKYNYFTFDIMIGYQKQFLEWCDINYKKLYFDFIKGKIIKIEKVKNNKMKYKNYELTKITYLA